MLRYFEGLLSSWLPGFLINKSSQHKTILGDRTAKTQRGPSRNQSGGTSDWQGNERQGNGKQDCLEIIPLPFIPLPILLRTKRCPEIALQRQAASLRARRTANQNTLVGRLRRAEDCPPYLCGLAPLQCDLPTSSRPAKLFQGRGLQSATAPACPTILNIGGDPSVRAVKRTEVRAPWVAAAPRWVSALRASCIVTAPGGPGGVWRRDRVNAELQTVQPADSSGFPSGAIRYKLSPHLNS